MTIITAKDPSLDSISRDITHRRTTTCISWQINVNPFYLYIFHRSNSYYKDFANLFVCFCNVSAVLALNLPTGWNSSRLILTLREEERFNENLNATMPKMKISKRAWKTKMKGFQKALKRMFIDMKVPHDGHDRHEWNVMTNGG